MQDNIYTNNFRGSVKFILAISIVMGGFFLYLFVQDNKSNSSDYASEVSQTDIKLNSQVEAENKFNELLLDLSQNEINEEVKDLVDASPISDYDLNTRPSSFEDESGQADQILAEAALLKKKKSEYQQLIIDFNLVEGDEKITLLHRLWQLAPEVGVDDNILILLHLAVNEPDARVVKMASKMLSDLQRFKDKIARPEESLVLQITEINNNQKNIGVSLDGDDIEKSELTESNGDKSSLPIEMVENRNEKIATLKELAINSKDTDVKEYALINLVQFDHDSALFVIQNKLLNSQDRGERIQAIEKLSSSIGDYDSSKIQQILEMASNDYDGYVSEYALNILNLLQNYSQDIE